MFVLKHLNSIILIMFQLSISHCVTGSSRNSQPINQTIRKSVSESSLCPPWTYLKDNSSDRICGDRMNGVVLCNESNTIWCPSSSDTALSVCLLTCHCMYYSEKI